MVKDVSTASGQSLLFAVVTCYCDAPRETSEEDGVLLPTLRCKHGVN